MSRSITLTHNGRTASISGGAAVPLRKGESHAIYNHTDRETRWFNFNVTDPGVAPDATDFGDSRAAAFTSDRSLASCAGSGRASVAIVCSATRRFLRVSSAT
ncbi:MAG: hypothetical protein FJY97_04535 [candidate division Zixibacteria bacterium]|nr:hypothetical protein [candidate division Zixibacteria bacterium]